MKTPRYLRVKEAGDDVNFNGRVVWAEFRLVTHMIGPLLPYEYSITNS